MYTSSSMIKCHKSEWVYSTSFFHSSEVYVHIYSWRIHTHILYMQSTKITNATNKLDCQIFRTTSPFLRTNKIVRLSRGRDRSFWKFENLIFCVVYFSALFITLKLSAISLYILWISLINALIVFCYKIKLVLSHSVCKLLSLLWRPKLDK